MLSAAGSDREIAAQTELPTADFWSVLGDADAAPAVFCHAWLALQCDLIPGAIAGCLILRGPDGASVPAAHWAGAAKPVDVSRLAVRALTEQRTVIAWGRLDGQSGPNSTIAMMVAQPLGPAATPYGAVALAVAPRSGVEQADPEGLARRLRAGSGWLELLESRAASQSSAAQIAASRTALYQAAGAMDALAAVGEHARLAPAAIALVNELAARLRCSRVSLGLVRNGAVRLQAMSNAATFQRSSAIVDAIEDAMEEALVQAAPVAHPPILDGDAPARLVAISHQALARVAVQDAAAMSVLLAAPDGRPAGVLTFERQGEPFDAGALALAHAVSTLIGPMIGLHAEAHRWVTGRATGGLAHGIRLLTGPRRPALKLAVAAVAAALVAMACATGTHRVTARAVLEGEVQRAAVAPFDGFVVQAPARAGDTVHAGDLLAALDDRELVLERAKAWAEREKLRQRHQEAAAKHDRAETAVLAAQIDQAEASLTLAEDRLARARIVAPIDGTVVSGDLSQMLGAPVERGHLLFEVAPLDRLRLALQVDDDSVRWVQPGQTGTLRLASLPGQRIAFTVLRRLPVASADDGRNAFRLEARLDAVAEGLRPGMEGVAKVEAGPRNLLWIWLHPVWDAARLALWKWAP